MSFGKEIDFESSLSKIVTTISEKLVFAGVATTTSPGTVCAIEIESNKINFHKVWQCHSRPVTRLHISTDGKYLFSGSEDGSLGMFRIVHHNGIRERHGHNIQKISAFTDEVLVSKKELDKKSNKIEYLRKQVSKVFILTNN